MCEYSPSGTLLGSCAVLGNGVFGSAVAVDNKSGDVFVAESNGLILEFGSTPTTPTAVNSLYVASGSGNPYGLAIDGVGNIYAAVSTGANKASSVFMFPAGSSGTTIPTQVIPSSYSPCGMALDSSGNLYISQCAGTSSGAPATGIYEFAAGSTTNSTPVRSISGAATTIYTTTDDEYLPLAADAAGNIFLSDAGSGVAASILVFSSTATGNVAPASTISSTYFDYASSLWLR
jgi:hypothetical protein